MKKYFIITIVSFVVLCACNFIFPLVFIDESQIPLVVTIISGWVSGLSTLAVGVVAFLQSKKYNDSNNEFIQKQFQLEQAKAIVQSRILFVDNIKKAWKEFVNNIDPVQTAAKILAINNRVCEGIINREIIKIITDSILAVCSNCNNILSQIELDFLESNEKTDLKSKISSYKNKYYSYFENQNNFLETASDTNVLFDFSINDFGKDFLDIVEIGNKYIIRSDFDINFSINYKIDDIMYLKEHYSPIKEK